MCDMSIRNQNRRQFKARFVISAIVRLLNNLNCVYGFVAPEAICQSAMMPAFQGVERPTRTIRARANPLHSLAGTNRFAVCDHRSTQMIPCTESFEVNEFRGHIISRLMVVCVYGAVLHPCILGVLAVLLRGFIRGFDFLRSCLYLLLRRYWLRAIRGSCLSPFLLLDDWSSVSLLH